MASVVKFDGLSQFLRQSRKFGIPLTTIQEVETSLKQNLNSNMEGRPSCRQYSSLRSRVSCVDWLGGCCREVAAVKSNMESELQTVQFPHIKSVLWDHTGQAPPVTVHIAHYRCLKVEVSSQVLRLAHRHLTNTTNNTFSSILIGSLTTSDEGHGVKIVLDRFDTGHQSNGVTVPKSHTPGDLLVPFLVCKSSQKDEKSIENYSAELQFLEERCRSKSPICLTSFIRLHGQCVFSTTDEGVLYTIQFDVTTPATEISATLVTPVPIVQTALSKNLCGPLSISQLQGEPKSGYLTMDHTRKLLLVLESDPKVYSLPLVGIWVSGAEEVYSTYVWASCLRYLYNQHIEDRVCASPEPFLLLLFSPLHSRPQFYDVTPTHTGKGLTYSLHTAVHTDSCPQTSDTASIILDSCLVENGPKCDDFDVALHQLKQTMKSKANQQDDESQPRKSLFNAEDIIPRVMPFPQPSQMPIKESQVPEVSIFFQANNSQKPLHAPSEYHPRPPNQQIPQARVQNNGQNIVQQRQNLSAGVNQQYMQQSRSVNSVANSSRAGVPNNVQTNPVNTQQLQQRAYQQNVRSTTQLTQNQATVSQNTRQMVSNNQVRGQISQMQNGSQRMVNGQQTNGQMVITGNGQQGGNGQQVGNTQQGGNTRLATNGQNNGQPNMSMPSNVTQQQMQMRYHPNAQRMQNVAGQQGVNTASLQQQQQQKQQQYQQQQAQQRRIMTNNTIANNQINNQMASNQISNQGRIATSQRPVVQNNQRTIQSNLQNRNIQPQQSQMLPVNRFAQNPNNNQQNVQQQNIPNQNGPYNQQQIVRPQPINQYQRQNSTQSQQNPNAQFPQNSHSAFTQNSTTTNTRPQQQPRLNQPQQIPNQTYPAQTQSQQQIPNQTYPTQTQSQQQTYPTQTQSQQNPNCTGCCNPSQCHSPPRVSTTDDTCRISQDSGVSITPERNPRMSPRGSPTHPSIPPHASVPPQAPVTSLSDLHSNTVPPDVYRLLQQQDTQLKQLQAQLQLLLAQSPPTSPNCGSSNNSSNISNSPQITKQINLMSHSAMTNQPMTNQPMTNQPRVTNTIAVNTSFRTIQDNAASMSIQTSPVKCATPGLHQSHNSTSLSGHSFGTPSDVRHTGAICLNSTQNLEGEMDLGLGNDLTQIMNDVAIHDDTAGSEQSEILLDMPSFNASPSRTNESHASKSPVSASMVENIQDSSDSTCDQTDPVSDKQFYNKIMTNIQTLLSKQNRTNESDDIKSANHPHDSQDSAHFNGTTDPYGHGDPSDNIGMDNCNGLAEGYNGGINDNARYSQFDNSGPRFDDTLNQYSRYCPDQTMMDTTFIPKINYVSMYLDSESNDTSIEINALAMKYLKDEQLTQMSKLRMNAKASEKLPQTNILRHVLRDGSNSTTPNITQYGMSSNDMSMATHKYMLRHGLIHDNGKQSSNVAKSPNLPRPSQQRVINSEHLNRNANHTQQSELYSSYLDVMPQTPNVQPQNVFDKRTCGNVVNPRNSVHSDNSMCSDRSRNTNSDGSIRSDRSTHSDPCTRSPVKAPHNESQDMVLDIAHLRQLPKLL